MAGSTHKIGCSPATLEDAFLRRPALKSRGSFLCLNHISLRTMILSLALIALCSTSQPRVSVEAAGFLRDTRVFFEDGSRFRLETMVQSPAVLSRREFLIEGLDGNGKVLFAQQVRAQGWLSTVRTPRWMPARAECQLPQTSGVASIRVRLARQ